MMLSDKEKELAYMATEAEKALASIKSTGKVGGLFKNANLESMEIALDISVAVQIENPSTGDVSSLDISFNTEYLNEGIQSAIATMAKKIVVTALQEQLEGVAKHTLVIEAEGEDDMEVWDSSTDWMSMVKPNCLTGTDKHKWYLLESGNYECKGCNSVRKANQLTRNG